MVPDRLSVVILGVRDMDRVRSFYTELGWKLRPRSGMFSRMDLSGPSIMLFPLQQLEEAVGYAGPPEGQFRGMSNAMIVGSVEEAESIVEEAEAAGGTLVSRTQERPWGSTTAYFADPELNMWEVAVFPGAEFDDRGAFVWPSRPPA